MAASEKQPPRVQIFGIGRESCASAYEPGQDVERTVWVLGFWSGMNTATASTRGDQTDGLGILAEVKLRCSRSPSKLLAQAAYEVWEIAP